MRKNTKHKKDSFALTKKRTSLVSCSPVYSFSSEVRQFWESTMKRTVLAGACAAVVLALPRIPARARAVGDPRPGSHGSRGLRGRARRRSAARRPPDRRGLRRGRPALRRRLLRLERQGRKAARREAAPDRAPRGHERRRPVRHERRVRRQDDVSRRRDVVRRLAVRGRAAEHLETDRHRRRRRGRSSARSGSRARR